MERSPSSVLYIYEQLLYCKNGLCAPDRLSCSDNHQHHCGHDRFPESEHVLLHYGHSNLHSGVSGSYPATTLV